GEIRRVGGERMQSVNVRIIAATARHLLEHTRRGLFRADLFHRLSVLCCEIPPLRARADDIPLLAHQLIAKIAERYSVSVPQLPPDTCMRLQAHSWPGNVRELANTIERALLLRQGSIITPASVAVLPAPTALSPHLASTPGSVRYSFVGSLEEEHAQIREALHACRGNKTRAAALLGMSRGTLLNKLRILNCE
ncbi:MAG TPA: helix-turn-helix domain-containing protein, partial [Longimicrobiales bacterium]|nr:helix-turn-helix domain-containing protein [Longimicrobiales bacterium]